MLDAAVLRAIDTLIATRLAPSAWRYAGQRFAAEAAPTLIAGLSSMEASCTTLR